MVSESEQRLGCFGVTKTFDFLTWVQKHSVHFESGLISSPRCTREGFASSKSVQFWTAQRFSFTYSLRKRRSAYMERRIVLGGRAWVNGDVRTLTSAPITPVLLVER